MMPKRNKIDAFGLAIANASWELPYLPLGMILAYLKTWGSGRLKNRYNIHPLLLGGYDEHPVDDMYRRFNGETRAVVMFSSYVWNHEANLAAACTIKELSPKSLVLFGGPEVPKYDGETEKFLRDHPFVDVAVLGEGEATAAELLDRLSTNWDYSINDLRDISGIVLQSSSGPVRTEARARIRDVNELPSPYLTGEFEPWFDNLDYTVLETNRGCPYGCTYCDWGSATLQKVTKFSPQRVIAEIEYIASKRAGRIFIADANFGMLEQDIEISQALVDAKKRTGYPKRVLTNFAKNGGRRLMQVIKILHEGGLLPTGIVALQTIDEITLKAIKRDNIKTKAYETMMGFFNAEGIPMASDLMIGLPGQTVDSFQRDLQFCFDWKISASGNYTSMMPNAPMAEASYREEHQIKVDDRGMIASTSSFTSGDLFYMKCLFKTYQFHVRLGIVKYYLYYLQIEHEVTAIEVLRRWLDRVRQGDSEIPLALRVFEELFGMENRNSDWALLSWGEEAAFLFDDLASYCREFHQFSVREFKLEVDPGVVDALISTQTAVIPRVGRIYPYTCQLAHDVVGYFRQVNNTPCLDEISEAIKPLKEFPPAKVRVAPAVVRKSVRFTMLDGHSNDFEYASNLNL